ncbi:class I adenylate-forming enzyme family protein [Actinomycetospora cinnamomea]|uniref:Long-chain acyl-CoA synthetase n=1 Tax=Actinomycetospora cinnamomea TaxID=663609 RepID=A0A2U1FBR2_9PSEU|nr:AMP-binding protein [Actinomycetospora cinnamomea]PVZ09622.1 long-chain acyl-CoA synthetase [Actinomycetospora cinnamomea]
MTVSEPTADWRTWVPERLPYPEVPVGALLDGAARRFGDRVAFSHHGRELTFTGLWRAACGFAHHLQARGVRPGDVVGVHLPNTLAFPVAYHGILLAGATFSPVSPQLPPEGVASQLADAGAVAVVGLADVGAGVPLIPTDGVGLGSEDAEAPPVLDLDPSVARAHLSYTGGTTGRPKGVVLTHANVVANVLQYACHTTGSRPEHGVGGDVTVEQIGPAEEWPVRLGEGVGIAVAPWFHAMGTVGGMTVPLVTGTTVIVHERFDPARFLADVETHRVTTVTGAPPLFHALLAHPESASRDLTSVQGISSGAAPMPVALAERLAERMPEAVIVEGYGMTEATMGLTFGATARSAHRRIGTVGVPVPDTEIVVGEPGAPVPAGEPGEVWARGPQVMVGYLDRPEDTAATLVDGWLRTGDIGVIGEDGLLEIVDRAKDMLLYKGYNVYPRHLEELLVAQPEVSAAAVVGRADPAVGEEPVAVVVPAPGTTIDGEVAARLAAAVDEHVAPYQRLRALHVAEALPVSAAGKVLKRELREQVGGAGALGAPVWRRDQG